MYSTLKGLVAVLAMPLPLFLGLLGFAALWLWAGWRRTGIGIATGAGVMLLLAATGPVSDRLLEPLERRYPPLVLAGGERGIDTIVVLGGGWQPSREGSSLSRLNESSLYRLTEGLKLSIELPRARLVLSGGRREGRWAPVAEAYAQAARELGLPADRLVVIEGPADTASEAHAVHERLGPGSRLLLVTSASHMPRAMAHFRAAGLDPVAAPTHRLVSPGLPRTFSYWVPTSQALRKTERALHEYMGLIALSWEQRGDVREFAPGLGRH